MWKATWALLFGASLMLAGCGETSEEGGPDAASENGEAVEENGAAENGTDDTAQNGTDENATTDGEDVFTITAEAMTVTQGAEAEFTVSVDRGDAFDQAVDVSLQGLPTGVTADAPMKTVAAGEDEVVFLLTAAPDAAAVEKQITVKGQPEQGAAVDVKVAVTVDKAE
jgi:hypothetical protein